MKIFGYGTFITSGFYKNYTNVQPGFLPGYIRIRRPQDPFPFILRNSSDTPNKGFWGLFFEVTSKQLDDLDYYEGGLYERIPVECIYKEGSKELSMTYYPTKKSIQLYNLTDFISEIDPWRLKIITDHLEIIKEFPELGWEHSPTEK